MDTCPAWADFHIGIREVVDERLRPENNVAVLHTVVKVDKGKVL